MKRGSPEIGELVVCRISKIHPNSAEAELLEYSGTGMIHVSEVAGRWVRDIREFIRENQYVVCRVVGSDSRGLSLSIKRVRRDEAGRRLNEFKREKKAGNMLEQAAKPLKKTREQAFKEVGFLLQEEFGSLTQAFETAGKNPALLKSKGVPQNWLDVISEIAQKKFAEKTFVVKADLILSSYLPDGLDVIKNLLASSRKKGFSISYISAPRYTISTSGTDIKKLRASIIQEGEDLVKAISKQEGEGKFALRE